MALSHYAKKFAVPTIAHAPSYPVQAVSHRERICRLYKRLYRMKEAQQSLTTRPNFLIWRTLLRHQFDVNKDIKDEREVSRLVEFAEQVRGKGETIRSVVPMPCDSFRIAENQFIVI